MNSSNQQILNSMTAGLKAEVLIEALPYIQSLAGRTVVIKYGGSAMVDPLLMQHVIEDITLLRFIGIRPVIVHGGGPEINRMLEDLQIESSFINGLRKTTQDVMDVVQMVLAGKINKQIVSELERMGAKAVGVSGIDAGLFRCEKHTDEDDPQADYGFVGKITGVNTKLIETLSEYYIPVIAPVGSDYQGQSYNINADTAAAELATALGADKLILLTAVEGVMGINSDGERAVLPVLTEREADSLIADGGISGGMIPKVKACITTVNKGVRRVHIIDGRLPHSILLEIFTHKGIGTMFTAQRRPYFPGENL